MGYTEDEFTCGLCSRTVRSIDEYVRHMIEDESCEVDFSPCEYIQDISLPKFIIPETSIKETKVIIISEPETTDFPKEELTANQWKCTLCPFTFSLYASFKMHSLKVHSKSSFTKNYDGISDNRISNNEAAKFIKLEKINPSGSKTVLELDEGTVNGDLKPHVFKKQKLHTNFTINDETNFDENSDIPEVHEIVNEENSDVFVLGEYGVSCQFCSQSFKTSRSLSQHLSTVHNSNKPFVCSYQNCEQSFKTKGSLDRHIRRHTGERPYVCGLCGRTFGESGTLVRHTQSKVSCVNKSNRQLVRYGLTEPFNHGDSKSAIKMLKKEEFMNNEDEIDAVEEDDNNQTNIASSTSEADNHIVCPIRKVKQERFDKDTKLFANKIDNREKLMDRTCPEVNLVELSENTQKPLLSLNIKQEHSHPKYSESNIHYTSVNNILNIKAEQRVNCDEECEIMSQSEENGYMDDLDCQSLSSAAPPSPSSVISFNPSLVEVPLYGSSVMENHQFNDLEDADIRDVKPRLTTDVKPRLANFDVKPNIPNMVESSNLRHDDNSDESASASGQLLERVTENKDSVMSKNGDIINRENLVVKYQCPFCERSFSQPSGILKHLHVHKKSLGPACLFCSKRFVSSEGLMRHMCRHASLRRLCCTLCAGEFKHPSQYNTHCLTHRQDKQVSCDICKKTFKTVSARNLHAKGHAGIREACDVCGRTFSTKSSLNRHLMIHSGEKPFICQHCNTPFRDSGTLTRHLKNKRPCSELEANKIQMEAE